MNIPKPKVMKSVVVNGIANRTDRNLLYAVFKF
jgi:hypothetical protein